MPQIQTTRHTYCPSVDLLVLRILIYVLLCLLLPILAPHATGQPRQNFTGIHQSVFGNTQKEGTRGY